jgi:hypothetical protein
MADQYAVVRIASCLLFAVPLAAQAPDTTVKVTWGGFVDGYYAWDFGQPSSFDRSFASGVPFTTQPARHNEFNVNLAFVEAKLDGARVRGRLAFQTGTSVQSNYAGEPNVGTISGPALSRHIQEAVVGAKVSDNLWIDGGVFFSHMGMESWISRDNPTYTRSLVAEYSPYYQSGVKATWTRGAVTAQVDVVNGWQNISENNTGKGVGGRIDYTRNGTTLSYYNFVSDEAGNLLRTFNGVGAKIVAGPVTWLAQADIGTQEGSAGAASTSWYGVVLIARMQMNAKSAAVARVERFDDKSQTIASTGMPGAAMRATGASLGIDATPAPRMFWRTEFRGWVNASSVFPGGSIPRQVSVLAVSSLSLSF